MTVTNDERREAAARLRKCIIFAKECDQNNEDEMIRENGNVMFRDIAEAVGGDYANLIDSYEETLTKLADLIEPEERTCHDISEPPTDGGFWPTPHFKCSLCRLSHVSMDYVFYCPNCGAKVIDD